MIKIGITGGIASGKSTICNKLEELRYPVFYADKIAKSLAIKESDLKIKLINEFGKQTFLFHEYNTKHVADIVFNDSVKLNKLNEIFKPYMKQAIDDFYLENKNCDDYTFYESALIIESGNKSNFDKVVCVETDPQVVLERIGRRDGFTLDESYARLNSQMDPYEKASLCDIVISGESDIDETIRDLFKKLQII